MEARLDHELVNKATNLLSILSKKDALSIFLLAKDGLRAETDTPQKIGLTRKQYYTRLKQLVDTCLIDKSGDVYVHTTLGSFVYQKQLLGLLEHVRNVKQLKMVDTLKRTQQFSEDEIANFVGKLTGSSLQTSTVLQVRLSSTYEDMVSYVLEQIQLAKNEILLASRFANDLIINNIIKKANAGLVTKVIADTDIVEGLLDSAKQSLAISDKNVGERVNVVSNPWYPQPENIGRRTMHIPYCMIIVDGKVAGVEMIDRNEPNKFKSAIFVKEEMFAAELRRTFNDWWKIAEDVDTQKLKMPQESKS